MPSTADIPRDNARLRILKLDGGFWLTKREHNDLLCDGVVVISVPTAWLRVVSSISGVATDLRHRHQPLRSHSMASGL